VKRRLEIARERGVGLDNYIPHARCKHLPQDCHNSDMSSALALHEISLKYLSCAITSVSLTDLQETTLRGEPYAPF